MKKIVTINFLLIFLFSCKSKEDKVIGMYKTNYNKGVSHILHIKKDHTFIQILKRNDSLQVNEGTWTLDKDGDLAVKNWLDLNASKNLITNRPLGICYPEPCGSSLLFVDNNLLKYNESDYADNSFNKINDTP